MKKLLTTFLLALLLTTTAFAQYMPQQKPMLGRQINWAHPLSRGLVGLWLFNEGSGNKVFDLSGNGQTAIFDSGDPPYWGAGEHGPVVVGVDEYITGTGTAINTSPGDMSIAAWYKVSDTSASYNIVASNGASISGSDLTTSGWVLGHCYNKSPSQVTFWIGPDAANQIRLGYSPSYTVATGSMSFVVVTFDSATKTAYLYINGIYQTLQQNANATSYANTKINILGASSLPAASLNGVVSGLAIYNHILPASEIALLCQEPFCMFEPSFDLTLYGAIAAPPAVVPTPYYYRGFIPLPIIFFSVYCYLRGRKCAA